MYELLSTSDRQQWLMASLRRQPLIIVLRPKESDLHWAVFAVTACVNASISWLIWASVTLKLPGWITLAGVP